MTYSGVAYSERLHSTSQSGFDPCHLLNSHKWLVAMIPESTDVELLGVPFRAASPSANESWDLKSTVSVKCLAWPQNYGKSSKWYLLSLTLLLLTLDWVHCLFSMKVHIWIFIPSCGPYVQNITILLYIAFVNAMDTIAFNCGFHDIGISHFSRFYHMSGFTISAYHLCYYFRLVFK